MKKHALPVTEESSDRAFADALSKPQDAGGSVEAALNFDMLAIPEELKKPGRKQRWIKKDTSGQKFRQQQRLGYTPIEEMEEYKDLVACDISAERAEQIKDYKDREADEQIASILANPNKHLEADGYYGARTKGDYSAMQFPSRDRIRTGRGDAVMRTEMENRKKFFDMGGR